MGRRNVSNVPAQALTLMNDPLVVQPGAALGRAAAAPAPAASDRERLDELFVTAFGRPADRATKPRLPGVPRAEPAGT